MPTPVGTIPVAQMPSIRGGEKVSFRIPNYQRGYRWKAEDVTRLLDDLDEFISEGLGGRLFYCLQPLVLKQGHDSAWEVVDGQQRLTTIFLLWNFLNEAVPFDLIYDTRKRSKEFLSAVSKKSQSEITNIDFHHIYHAHRAIQGWFQNDLKKARFKSLLADTNPDGRNVRFIWYELDVNDDPVAAFTRLNVGKIPLTDDELIRALFLRHPSGGHLANFAFQHRLALEWDLIETALQDPEFWGFLSPQLPPEGSRIRLLLALCAPESTATNNRGIFQHFELKLRQASAEDLRSEWQQIVSRFEQLKEWHDDPDTFHLVGVVATVVGDGSSGLLRRLLDAAAQKNKSAFVASLRNEIRSKLMGNANTLREFVEKLDYTEDLKLIRQTLALFNIAMLVRAEGVRFRFPFDLYHGGKWDVEHIQSQAGDGLGDQKRQRQWLEACAVELREELGPCCEELLHEIENFLNKQPGKNFENIEKSIREQFDESDSMEDIHGIGNLTLLDFSTNRAYGNAPFVVKRSKILEAERDGRFLLPCTRDLFLKVFSKNPGNLRRWDLKKDGTSHETAICETLEAFFDKKGRANS